MGTAVDSKEKRRQAAEMFAHALHTGESGAVRLAAPYLADDVIVTGRRDGSGPRFANSSPVTVQ